MKKILASLLFWILSVSIAGASTLSSLITSMPNDSWAVFTPANTNVIGGGLTTSYADSAAWDPVHKKLLFLGSDHGVGYDFVYWDDATNSWTSGPAMTGVPKSTVFVGHAWDGNAADMSGNFYYLCRHDSCNSNNVFKYNVGTNAWSILPANTGETNENNSCCQSLVYFPEMGGLLWITTVLQVWKFGDVSQTWSLVGQAPGANCGTWNFAEYNPVKKIVLMGCGDGAVFKMNSAGTITQMASNPYNIYNGSGYAGHVTVDPVTGIFIIITTATAACHTYDVDANTYGNCAAPPSAIQGSVSGATIPVPNYGAILYFNCGGTTGQCAGNIYVYKRAVGGTDPDFNFAGRCAAPGVTVCQGMNTMGTYGNADLVRMDVDGVHGNIRARSDGQYRATVDTSIKKSGAGALKFQLDAGYAASSIAGQYIPNTNDGLGAAFGQNSDMYIQYAVRLSPEMFTNLTPWDSLWKLSIFHMDQASCGGKELTVRAWNQANPRLMMYKDCGAAAMVTDPDGHTWKSMSPPYLYQQGNYSCDYDNETTCWDYPTNDWITLYFHVHNGTWGTANSSIEAWYAIDGQPYRKWINVTTNFTIGCNNSPCPGEVFNNITLTPYMTNLSVSAPATAYAWFDELIVSTQPIAAPEQVISQEPPPPPSTATYFRRRLM